MEATFKEGEFVLFQAYPENTPELSKVKRKGTLDELGKAKLDKDDTRIFHELISVKTKSVFTCTTDSSLFKITDDLLFRTSDGRIGKSYAVTQNKIDFGVVDLIFEYEDSTPFGLFKLETLRYYKI